MNLSKTRYASYCQCPKKMWLDVNEPEKAGNQDAAEARMEEGLEVGEYAKSYYGPYVDVTAYNEDGSKYLNQMLENTRIEREKGTLNICEASFSYDGCYCAVDILRLTGNNMYEINEIKSCTCNPDSEKECEELIMKYINDIGYQKWVLTKLGIAVSDVNIICLNSNYTVPVTGVIDNQSLFCKINASTHLTAEFMAEIEKNVYEAKMVLDIPEEIENGLGLYCKKPFDCPYIDYCTKCAGIKYPSVFGLYRAQWKKKLEYMNKGILSFEDVQPLLKSEMQKIQVASTLAGKERIDKRGLLEFVDSLRYPLYFLDFETMNEAIPTYVGTKPYQQVPFQYSLHIKESAENPEMEHREFLGDPKEDPRRALAEQLCRDIPVDGCVIAYNKQFECGRIRELADMYPDLSYHLLRIEANIVDLLIPFQNGLYYTPEMKGSFSIKSVLPALYPDSEELNYHNLNENVQNGAMAMTAYPAMKHMNESECAVIRKALLDYCCLDTLAMARVLDKIYEAINNN